MLALGIPRPKWFFQDCGRIYWIFLSRELPGELASLEIEWKEDAAVCVVMASGGYPGTYKKGKIITGLEELGNDTMVFHAGTELRDGSIVSNRRPCAWCYLRWFNGPRSTAKGLPSGATYTI